MYGNRLLRKQVVTELKLRRYAFLTLLLLSLAYLFVNLVFSDTGILRYLQLREKESALGGELAVLFEENAVLRSSVITYRTFTSIASASSRLLHVPLRLSLRVGTQLPACGKNILSPALPDKGGHPFCKEDFLKLHNPLVWGPSELTSLEFVERNEVYL
jgi:hypothetical protein